MLPCQPGAERVFHALTARPVYLHHIPPVKLHLGLLLLDVAGQENHG